MGILDRLGNLLKTYINDGMDDIFGEREHASLGGDPGYDAAFEELNDFLNGGNAKGQGEKADDQGGTSPRAEGSPPAELRPDFELLGVPFGADKESCKDAWKKLLKTHHPDKHANHEGNMKKATEKTARINAAFERIENWRQAPKNQAGF
jgi:hypothetical protein